MESVQRTSSKIYQGSQRAYKVHTREGRSYKIIAIHCQRTSDLHVVNWRNPTTCKTLSARTPRTLVRLLKPATAVINRCLPALFKKVK